MPNWANTNYVAVGDKEQLNKLHEIMKKLENMKSSGLLDKFCIQIGSLNN